MLYYNTVNKTLSSVLHSLMESSELNGFHISRKHCIEFASRTSNIEAKDKGFDKE